MGRILPDSPGVERGGGVRIRPMYSPSCRLCYTWYCVVSLHCIMPLVDVHYWFSRGCIHIDQSRLYLDSRKDRADKSWRRVVLWSRLRWAKPRVERIPWWSMKEILQAFKSWTKLRNNMPSHRSVKITCTPPLPHTYNVKTELGQTTLKQKNAKMNWSWYIYTYVPLLA